MNWKYILLVVILAVVVGVGIYWWSSTSPELLQRGPPISGMTGGAYIIFSTGAVVNSESDAVGTLKSNRASIQEAINRKLQEVNWVLPEELGSDLAELTVLFDRYSIEKRGWQRDKIWPLVGTSEEKVGFFQGELFVVLAPAIKNTTSWTVEDDKVVIRTALGCQNPAEIMIENLETGEKYCSSGVFEKKVVAPNIKLLVSENGVIYLGGFQVGGSL